METFEKYWKSSPGTGDLSTVSPELVTKIAEAAYTAGQVSALKWYNSNLEK